MAKVEERSLSIEEFLRLEIPMVDVRAPIEFNKGHIPAALNEILSEPIKERWVTGSLTLGAEVHHR